MKALGFTPGPWLFTKEPEPQIINADGVLVAGVRRWDSGESSELDVTDADARIMAASRELLEAAELMLVELNRFHAIGDNHGRPCAACSAGEAGQRAIAKARGETK